MSERSAGRSGLKLPLFLLLGFVVAIAGIVIWLTLSEPDKPPPEAKSTSQEDKSLTASTKAAVKPPTETKPVLPKEKEEIPTPPAETEPPKIAEISPPDDGLVSPKTDKPGLEKTQDPPAPDAPPETATAMEPPPPKVVEKRPATPPRDPDPQPAPKTVPAKKIPQKVERAALRERPVMPKPLRRIIPDDPLPPAPDPALVQSSAIGPLPKIADDGRLPYRVYAKPFDASDKRPRIGIVVTGLGLSDAATESAIQGLPGGVTLAFAPYSSKLDEWMRLARAAGHEVLLNVPMEPLNYPAYDPGPQTLLTSLNTQGNLDRLLWSLSRGSGYVGVMDFFGSRFTASRKHMEPVLGELKRRGLLYLDSGASPRSVTSSLSAKVSLPSAVSSIILDERASRTNLDRKFGELERRAKSEGRAIGVASPYPVTLERIADWARQLRARGFAIAPISALTGTGSAQKAKK